VRSGTKTFFFPSSSSEVERVHIYIFLNNPVGVVESFFLYMVVECFFPFSPRRVERGHGRPFPFPLLPSYDSPADARVATATR